MVVKLQMRFFIIRGGGDKQQNEIAICNAHFHNEAAKGSVNSPVENFNKFMNALADDLSRYECRLLTTDANMALYRIIPEMRARGFQISLAAWYSLAKKLPGGMEQTVSDSTAIFVIGPTQGIRMLYTYNVFGIGLHPLRLSKAPIWPDYLGPSHSMVMEDKWFSSLQKFGKGQARSCRLI